MKLNDEQKLSLEALYLHHAVPLDQLRRTPAVLSAITSAFNNVTGLEVEPGELLRYMITRRKKSQWPTLGDRAKRFPQAIKQLTEHQRSLLRDVYEELDVTSDEILLCPKFAKRLVALFAERSGAIFPSNVLVPALFQLRKRGMLPSLREETVATADAGAFSDIAEVARRHRAKA
jgi:hypothetical protein